VTWITDRELGVWRMSVNERAALNSKEVGCNDPSDFVLIANLPKDLPPYGIEPIPNLDRSKPDRLDRCRYVQFVWRIASRPR